MTDQFRAPVGGGVPKSPKKTRGRGWLAKRNRASGTWAQRKARSRRYCAPQPVINRG